MLFIIRRAGRGWRDAKHPVCNDSKRCSDITLHTDCFSHVHAMRARRGARVRYKQMTQLVRQAESRMAVRHCRETASQIIFL